MYLNAGDMKTIISAIQHLRNTGDTELADELQTIIDKITEIKKQRSNYSNKRNKIRRGTYKGE